MLENFKKALTGAVSFVLTWLALSYIFFPIKLFAPPSEYFRATMTHMMPLKFVIALIFTLLAVFMYEQKAKKKSKQSDNVSK